MTSLIPLKEDLSQSLERGLIFGAVLDNLSAPTPAQLWLEQAAAQLDRERDPDGSKRASTARLKVKVMERDGSDCWFCDKPLNGDVTLEHLQPLALGGNWNLDNLALAHNGCNKSAGHLSRIKKEALRETMNQSKEGRVAQQDQSMGDCAARTVAGGASPLSPSVSAKGAHRLSQGGGQ